MFAAANDSTAAANPFGALFAPEGAIAAHQRLTAALKCERFSPLDKPLLGRAAAAELDAYDSRIDADELLN